MLFLGRLIKGKNPLFALSVLLKLREKYQDCELHIVGNGPELQSIKDFINYNKLDNVYIYGDVIEESEIAVILSKCDIMISPGYIGLNLIHA